MIYYIETAFITLSILTIIFFQARRGRSSPARRSIFFLMIYANGLIALAELSVRLLEGQNGEAFSVALFIAVSLLYLLIPVPPMIYGLFVKRWIDESAQFSKRYLAILSIPLLITIIIVLVNIFIPIAFTITPDNNYLRGPGFALIAFMMFGYLLHWIGILFRGRNKLSKREIAILTIFAIPSLTGAFLQWAFDGVMITWVAMSIALLIVFINLQNVDVYSDFLTQLSNRRGLDAELRRQFNRPFGTQQLAGFLVDMDGFKLINDIYGHHEGDEALIEMASLLKRSFRANDFICRYGGDEFIILAMVDNEQEIASLIRRLEIELDHTNRSSSKAYELAFSVGTSVMTQGMYESVADFLLVLDHLMYEQKQKRHRN